MQIPDFPLREPQYFSTVKLFEYWQANSRVLIENQAFAEEQKFLGRQKVNEKITGYYLMGNATLKQLNILAGVRVEETEIVAQGSRTLPTSGPNNVLPAAGVNANSIEGVRAKYRSSPPIRTTAPIPSPICTYATRIPARLAGTHQLH